jgi:hypothetical protein
MISFPRSFARSALRALPFVLVLTTPVCVLQLDVQREQAFSDAEKARARGDTPAAETAYRGAIDRRTAAFETPTSRWTDDALLLIARARFALANMPARPGIETALASLRMRRPVRQPTFSSG